MPYARYPTSFTQSLCISVYKCSFLFVHLHCFEYYAISCVSLIPGRPYIPWPLFCFKYHLKDNLQEFGERKQNFPDTLFVIPELSGSAIHVWSLASGNSGVFLAPTKSAIMWPMWSLQTCVKPTGPHGDQREPARLSAQDPHSDDRLTPLSRPGHKTRWICRHPWSLHTTHSVR